MGIFDKKENWIKPPIQETDVPNKDAYAWHLYETYWKMEAMQTVSFILIDRDYYRADLKSGDIIFFNPSRNECRVLTREDAAFPTEESWLREFGRRLTHAMEARGINQYDLAELTGYSQSSISSYCSGRKCPSTYALAKIVRCLKCSTEFLTKLP